MVNYGKFTMGERNFIPRLPTENEKEKDEIRKRYGIGSRDGHRGSKSGKNRYY